MDSRFGIQEYLENKTNPSANPLQCK